MGACNVEAVHRSAACHSDQGPEGPARRNLAVNRTARSLDSLRSLGMTPRGGPYGPRARRAVRGGCTALALAGLVALAAVGCTTSDPVELVETRPAISTEIAVRVIAPDEATALECMESAWREMETCALLLDRWTEGSDVATINKQAGRFHAEVDPITISCLAAAREAWGVTEGAFDPTVGPLLSLWRKAQEDDRLPAPDEVEAARQKVGVEKIEILAGLIQRPQSDVAQGLPSGMPPTPEDLQKDLYTVGIREGMELDLGGIAKGYIAGRMARRMQLHGAIAGLVAAAGDVYAFGRRPPSLVKSGRDARWGVAVQDPRYPDEFGRAYTAIHLENQSVDTSGHYYRGYEIAGKHYSHIIAPRTGRPVDTRLASATVVARDPAFSDGLATAMAVLGVEKGLALVDSLEGVECLLLEWKPKEGETAAPSGAPPKDAELIAHRSSGFAAMEFDPSRLAGQDETARDQTPAGETAGEEPPAAAPAEAP